MTKIKMEERNIVNTIAIKAPAKKVWNLLTKPEHTKQYMFGCETVSDWKPGSRLDWVMQHEGKELTAVKGNVVTIKPDKKLVYTVFDPNSGMEDKPENYLNVQYDLQEEDGTTTLTVTQGDYNKVGDGDRRYNESYNNGEGWNPILVQIRELAEK
jgi:uncharacterized protein YndB with AHSA1/START domain